MASPKKMSVKEFLKKHVIFEADDRLQIYGLFKDKKISSK